MYKNNGIVLNLYDWLRQTFHQFNVFGRAYAFLPLVLKSFTGYSSREELEILQSSEFRFSFLMINNTQKKISYS